MSKAPSKALIAYLPDFLDYTEIVKGLAENSLKNYHRFLQKFIFWLKENNLQKIRPDQLTADLVWQYRLFLSRSANKKTRSGLKKNTQNLYLIALRALLEFFAEKDIQSLPPSKVKLAKEKGDKEIKFLNLQQIESLLLSPNLKTQIGRRDRAILEALFSTGLRVEELVNLNRDQIGPLPRSRELEVAVIGKGRKIRTVYFSERSVAWLKKYLDSRHDLDQALFSNYWRAAKNGDSRRLTKKRIEDIVKKYVRQAGLPVMATPHTLRHSFATDLLMQGVDLRLVQEFLGHRNIATTQIYTHVTNKQLKDVHHRLHGGTKIKN